MGLGRRRSVASSATPLALPVPRLNDSERDFISGEVLTNFGKHMGPGQVDPGRLREVLASTIAQPADRADITRLRDIGAHPFVVPTDGEGFELRLGHDALAMLDEPGTVAGEYVSPGLVKTADIAAAPRG